MFGLILIIATTLAYQPAWRGGLIWDDDLYLKNTQSRSLEQIWIRPATTQQYHPLVGTVFWIESKLWGDSMLGHHLLNILLHACSALLLFKILERLEVPGAWLAAAIFALHPVQVESVAWLVEVKNTLSGVFFFSAICVYLQFDQSRNKWFYSLALVLFLLGLLAKTIVAVFPIALLILLWWKRGRIDSKRDVAPLVPFIAIGLVAGTITSWMEQKLSGAEGAGFEMSILERFLIAGRAFWFYLAKLLWPTDLTLIYPRWNINPDAPWQYLFPVAAILLIVAAWLLRRQSRGPLAGLLFFVAVLFPLLGFFNVYYFAFAFVADHFQYLASAGIIALVCGAGFTAFNRASASSRMIGRAAAIVVVATLAALTWRQARLYHDAETIFRDVVLRNPESATAHNNLGSALIERGATEAAIAHFRRALELKPNYQRASYNLGATLVTRGDFADAIPRLKAVLQNDPNYAEANYSLATALAQTGERDQAIGYYERVVQLAPEFPDAHSNLANLLLEKGQVDEALMYYRKAVTLAPKNPGTHYNLAVGLTRKGELDPAIEELRTALQLDPAYPDAGPLLRDLLAKKQQP